MGTLETPQDRHRYIHRTGPPEWNRQTEVQVEQGAQEAWRSRELGRPWRSRELGRPWRSRELGRPWQSRELGRPWRSRELGRPWWDRLRDRGPSPHLSLFGRSPTTPPQISLGKLRGIRSPPGLNTQKQLKRPWSQSGQIRPRPAGLSIRQRPAGETITGWLDK